MVAGVAVPLLIFEVLMYALLGMCLWHALLIISLSMLVVSLIVHGALIVSVLGTPPTPPSSPLASQKPLRVQWEKRSMDAHRSKQERA
jgi:hypothetical protein